MAQMENRILKIVSIIICILSLSSICQAQDTDFSVTRKDNILIINYKTDVKLQSVDLQVSFDDGRTYTGNLSISGDTYDVYPGEKIIVWRVLDDYPEGFEGTVRFKLIRNAYKNRNLTDDGKEFPKGLYMGITGGFLSGSEYSGLGEFTFETGYIVGRYSIGANIGVASNDGSTSLSLSVIPTYFFVPRHGLRVSAGFMTTVNIDSSTTSSFDDDNIYNFSSSDGATSGGLFSLGYFYLGKSNLYYTIDALGALSGDSFSFGARFGIGLKF